MSENNPGNNQQPAVMINIQYIKDLSLEIPHAPSIFGKMNKPPHLKVDIDVQSQKLENSNYNVLLNLAVNGELENEKLFIFELSYGAVVSLNVPEEHIEPVLGIEIPRLLFPFARNIMTQCLTEGGLPPFMLNPIDFATVYNARKAAAANADAPTTDNTADNA